MTKQSIQYQNINSIRLVELVKNLESNDSPFFFVFREPKLDIELDFDTKTVDEFLEFTNKYIYERLLIFECNQEDISDIESFYCSA